MKKLISLCVPLIAGCVLLVTSCQKKTPNVEPKPDTEFQSSVDASIAATIVSDIDMICSFAGQNDFFPKFYMPAPGSPAGFASSRDINDRYLFIGFNNTKCMDGKVRTGSIYMYYGFTNPNARYYQDFEFEGKVSLIGYKVDEWSVEGKNTFVISNKLTASSFDPSQTNLSWSLKGDFNFVNSKDSSRNMHCNVDLIKTLANTNDKKVFDPTKKTNAITWPSAVVEYKGTMFGETSTIVPFKYTIGNSDPLLRDFTCYPVKTASTSTLSPSTQQEFHPFTKGRVAFVTGDLYPRDLSYGNEQNTYHDVKNTPLTLSAQCDNKGIVTIKGISYPLDFEKDYK